VTDLDALLGSATTIELVDWPHQDVPATLVRAGYSVVAARFPQPAAGEAAFLTHEVVDGPSPVDGVTFPLEAGKSHLRFADLDSWPDKVDIVCIYRPPEEQEAIVAAAVEAGVGAVWIEPGANVSNRAKQVAKKAGIPFVDGVSIAEAVRQRRDRAVT
jgi:ribosomal protein S16